MRQFTSEAAKSLITIIGTEYAMAQKRVERRFIEPDRMLGTLFERLNRLATDNINLRKFLDNVGHIPVEEDESMDLDWAKDPREGTCYGPDDDQPYDDGKPEPRYGTSRDGQNKLTSQSKRDSKT